MTFQVLQCSRIRFSNVSKHCSAPHGISLLWNGTWHVFPFHTFFKLNLAEAVFYISLKLQSFLNSVEPCPSGAAAFNDEPGVYVPLPWDIGSMSLEECFEECLKMEYRLWNNRCVGVDYQTSTSKCFVHYSYTISDSKVTDPDFSHYIRKECGML